MQEGLLDFPATLDGRQLFSPVQRGRLDSEGRQLLKIMSAVSRDWNTVAQTILRRRCGAHSLQELEAFLRSSYCGNWVQESQFVMGTCAAEGLIDSPDNPFGALAADGSYPTSEPPCAFTRNEQSESRHISSLLCSSVHPTRTAIPPRSSNVLDRARVMPAL